MTTQESKTSKHRKMIQEDIQKNYDIINDCVKHKFSLMYNNAARDQDILNLTEKYRLEQFERVQKVIDEMYYIKPQLGRKVFNYKYTKELEFEQAQREVIYDHFTGMDDPNRAVAQLEKQDRINNKAM